MKFRFLIFILFLNSFLVAKQDLQIKLELADVENVVDKKTGRYFSTAYLGNTFKIKVNTPPSIIVYQITGVHSGDIAFAVRVLDAEDDTML